MLKQFSSNDLRLKHVVADDPVRPHIPCEIRVTNNRMIFCDESDHKINAVVCVAFTNKVAIDESDLESYSDKEFENTVAMLYTLWSYEKGAGRQLALDIIEHIKNKFPYVDRIVTLSPQTQLARRFHIKNGAVELQTNENTVNFEYFFTKFNELA